MELYKIPKRPTTSQLYINMTDEMYEILCGALLGDGCLYKSKNIKNAHFIYTSSSYQHVEYVTQRFMEYSNTKIQYLVRYDKRTKTNNEIYKFRSLSSPTLTEEYDKWYHDGVKHIPDSLVLTPLMCKIWYLGDGSLINFKGKTHRLELCTQCFDKEELDQIIIPQLEKFHPMLKYCGMLKNGNASFAIVIYRQKDVKNFLEYIGECPFDDYKHKWDFHGFFLPNY